MTKVVENTIKDLVGSLLYYDRKEDEDLPHGELEKQATVEEVLAVFERELRKAWRP